MDKLKTEVLSACTQPLFEITNKRSPEWISMPGIDTQITTSTTAATATARTAIITCGTTDATKSPYTSSNATTTATNNCYKPSYESNISCCDSEGFFLRLINKWI